MPRRALQQLTYTYLLTRQGGGVKRVHRGAGVRVGDGSGGTRNEERATNEETNARDITSLAGKNTFAFARALRQCLLRGRKRKALREESVGEGRRDGDVHSVKRRLRRRQRWRRRERRTSATSTNAARAARVHTHFRAVGHRAPPDNTQGMLHCVGGTQSMAEALHLFLFLLFLARARAMGEIVREVQIGSTAELPCPSSDDAHRFQFWLLLGDGVLGPSNEMDPSKYKYDVLSGRLFIKSISSSESGLYTCVSKELDGTSLNSKTVEVIVKKDWEDLYETDPTTNLMRGLIAMGVLLIIFIVGIVIYFLRRTKIIHIRDMTDEESPDETPGTYSAPGMSSINDFNATTSQGVDNPSLETDFPQVFRSMQQVNDSRI